MRHYGFSNQGTLLQLTMAFTSKHLVSACHYWRHHRKLRFMAIGAWNTIFGYLVFLLIYFLSDDHLHYLLIATMAHLIAITHAFAMHRYFVFYSRGNLLKDFVRFNLSHAVTLLLGLIAITLLVEMLGLSPTIAQAIVLLLSVILSYILHSRFSFTHQLKSPPQKT